MRSGRLLQFCSVAALVGASLTFTPAVVDERAPSSRNKRYRDRSGSRVGMQAKLVAKRRRMRQIARASRKRNGGAIR